MQIDASRRFVAVSRRNILPEAEALLISIQMKLLNVRFARFSSSLSLSRFLTSFAKHPLALYMLCLVYMLVCIFVYQPGTIVAREIDEAVLIGAFGFHLIVARLEWNFNRLNDRSRHRSDDDLFKRMSDDLKRRWNRRFQWKTKKRQVFD